MATDSAAAENSPQACTAVVHACHLLREGLEKGLGQLREAALEAVVDAQLAQVGVLFLIFAGLGCGRRAAAQGGMIAAGILRMSTAASASASACHPVIPHPGDELKAQPLAPRGLDAATLHGKWRVETCIQT